MSGSFLPPSGGYHYYKVDLEKVFASLGKKALLRALEKMLLIRNFETRAEAAYKQGQIGGFFHSYIGQEAIQTAILEALGPHHWYVASYRCHALALLLGVSPESIMAELYGRATGNAKGRGGSMHLYADRLLGGFGIVGGQMPIAIGAAFSSKYLEKKEIAVCFLGDGAVAQGAFHESLNLAALWHLPCLFVVENNHWGMGTGVERALSVTPIAELKGPGYGIAGYSVDGSDFLACYGAFKELGDRVLAEGRPILVEVVTERFRGHSVSDPGKYRSKECLEEAMKHDPIQKLKGALLAAKMLDEEDFNKMDKALRQQVVAAMEEADKAPWPEVATLEEDVFAP